MHAVYFNILLYNQALRVVQQIKQIHVHICHTVGKVCNY